MDPEDESGSVGQGQNLHDLQNYLSTFNKEIEPGDDVLATMGVDSGVEDVSDLYSSTSGNPLQEPGEGGVASQFSSGFYSEQGILDTPLSDESAQQIQNLVSGADRDPDNDMTQTIKQEVGTIDLEAVQAQITNFGDAQLSQGIGDLQGTSMNQGLIMASLGDNLDPSAGKVIRIVSLGEEGQYFSLGDGSQMQILNQDLGITTDSLTTPDTSALALQSETGASANIGATIPSSILTTAGVSSVMVAAQGSTITTVASSSSSGITGTTQLVALQSSSDNSQPQLVALPQGTALTTEALQMSGLLSADGTLNSELGYQTITIVPSELSQGGDMNYVLIMAPQEGQKEGTQSLAQVVDLKQENQEVGEELVEINGEVKRVLRVIPKKYITSNFGAQLMCDYCDYTSPKRYLLTRHMKSHSDERPHKCKECDRGFKTPASLLNHINTHTGTRPHKCKTCDAAFTTSGELVRHIRYRHTFEKPHRCPNCDYASVELSKLKRHMRSHTGERPYKCPHCPYASPDTYKLKRHLRIHTGEKPYECDICHARFTQSNSLKAHKLIHSGNKPVFQCNLCPTTCGRKTDLKIHFNKLHSMGSPLECKKCSQVFSDRYSYKQHVRAHDIDKCFKCEECDFIANTERSFDLHAAIHSNGKKFECDICHTSFNLQQSLDKHKLSCSLGGESGADSCSSPSRDKESTDEQSMDKSIVYRSTIGRPSHEGKSDTINSPEEGSSNSMSSQLMHGPLASDTLHKNLLQDIKAGKLGDVPQVVIVHPDGSLEEISSKLPMGDKLNLEDIFSALSNNEKVDSVENDSGESSQAKQTARGGKDNGDDIHRSTDSTKDRESRNIASDGEEDDNDNNGESSQCEASTQAELESDTDSVDDSHSVDSPAVKAARKETQSTQASTSASADQSAISSLSAPATSVTEGALDPTTGGSTNALASLLQTVTTSATSASLCTSLSSLLPSSSSSLLSTSTSDQAAASGNQQYVVVKGYTCLSGDTGQPTLVNVAVDKDALMKMFASLGNSGEGGLQLLTGDFDPSISVPMDTTQSGVFPVTQLPLHEFTNLSSISDAQVLNDSITTESNEGDSNTAQTTDSRKEMIPTNSEDILKNNLCETSHDDINISSSDNSVLKYSQSMTSDKLKDSGDKFLAGTSEPISISTQRRKDCISSTSSSSLPLSSPFVSLKMSLSNEQLSTEPLHQCQDTDSSVKLSLCDEAMETDPFPCEDSTIDETTADASIHLSDHLTSSQSRLGKLSSECADTDFSSDADQDLGGSSVLTIVQDAVSLGGAVDDDGADDAFGEGLHTPVKKETMVASLDRQKRSSRKRSSTTDPALVMTGKRVRKALVKVSM